jgi:transglutaminase-like putative cysteine protease
LRSTKPNNMKNFVFLSYCLILSLFVTAQNQNSDSEGSLQAGSLKRLSKKAKYGISLIEQQFTFSTGKGISGNSVVTAEEDGKVEMVSIEDKAVVGYLLPYNQFLKLKDYDFQIYYRNNFKTQKYPAERVSLSDDNIFLDDNFGLFYGFKALESGTRSRFTYNYQYSDAKYLTRIFFHQHIPVLKHSVSFKVPSWLELSIIEKNFGPNYKIKKDTKKEKDFTIYTFTAENLAAVNNEPSSLGRPFYLPHLVVTVRSFTINKEKFNGFSNLADMYAWYNLLYKKAENNTDAIKAQVSQLTQGKGSDEEKVKSIYYWVQDNIRYIAFEEGYAGFIPQTVQDVYKNKYGDCKGMANLVTEMLKIAGYDAHFAWIGTRDIPYDRNEIQSLCVDNHAISVLYLKGKPYFLDGTEKYAPLGKNAYRIQGKNALVQDGDSYKVETVPAATVDENIMGTHANFSLKGDKISGRVVISFEGEARNYFHNLYNGISADKRKTFLKNLVELGSNNAEAANIKTSDFKNRDIPLVIEADVEISNQVTRVDKLCYTSIDFVPASIVKVSPDNERQNPYDLDAVFLAKDEITLELPAGTKAHSLPEKFQAAFKTSNMEAVYKLEGNKVVLKKTLQLNSPVIYKTDFDTWKTFVNQIKEFNRTNIALQLP